MLLKLQNPEEKNQKNKTPPPTTTTKKQKPQFSQEWITVLK